jgi:hypothetical protein
MLLAGNAARPPPRKIIDSMNGDFDGADREANK